MEEYKQKTPNKILSAVGHKFQRDFLKYALITIWFITIVFMLIINIIIMTNIDGSYGESVTNAFKAFDITKIKIEIAVAIPILVAMILIFFKRNIAHKIGLITSSVIIFQSAFLSLFYNTYSSLASTGIETGVFDPHAGWNTFRHGMLTVLHLAVIVMIIIDMKKTAPITKVKDQPQKNNNLDDPKKETTETRKETVKEESTKQVENEHQTYEDNYQEHEITQNKNSEENNVEKENEQTENDSKTPLSSEDLSALDELSKVDVSDSDKEADEEELRRLSEENKDK